MPEIAVFADFHWTFFLYFVVFPTKTLLITMPTIKHCSIVIKTDFCSRNFLKSAGTADIFAGKMVFLEFLELFHENLHTGWKMMVPKI